MTTRDRPDILRSPAPYHHCSESDDEYGFESWEVHAELLENEKYPELLDYCKQEAEHNPEDIYALIRLGEAYVLNQQYETAIQVGDRYHQIYPEISDFQHIILDALFAQGKTEDDHNWVQRPCVFRLGRTVLDSCYDYLRLKRKPRGVEELCIRFIIRGYPMFSEEELLQALANDDRFSVRADEVPQFAKVRVSRKG
jgi:tetratricopeptide (TPR) repeat protein